MSPRILNPSSFLLLALALACDSGASPAKSKDAASKSKGDAAVGDADKGGDGKAAEAKADTKTDAKTEGAAKTDAKSEGAAKAGAKTETGAKPEVDDGTTPQPPAKPPTPSIANVELEALYWASSEEGKTAIDIIDIPATGSEDDPVGALAEAHDYPDGIAKVLPDTAKLPDGFAKGDAWVVATTSGKHAAKAVAFGAMGGASESHFVVVLGGGKAEGLAARESAWRGGTIPSLQEAKALDLSTPEGEALVAAIVPSIVATAKGRAKRIMARKAPTAGHLTVIEGRFPNGFTHLVALRQPPKAGTSEFDDHVSGLLLADATGRVEAINPPQMSLNYDEFRYLVDLGGDGIDEVVFDDSYYEGSYSMVLGWDAAGKPAVRTLTGDGA